MHLVLRAAQVMKGVPARHDGHLKISLIQLFGG
jgi:hypothetical protein